MTFDGRTEASSADRLSVSVVTCAYTEARWSDLAAAIDSARHQTRPPEEIILVIDHNDKLRERAEQAFPDVLVTPNSRSRGASGSRNTGIGLARGEVIAFLDDDARATQTWLAELLGPFAEQRVAGVGGDARPVWPSARPGWFPAEFDWVLGCSYVGLPRTQSAVRNPLGTNMAVRHTLALAVGGFREGFGNIVLGTVEGAPASRLSTGEETDFCIRVSAAHPNMVFMYEPSAVVYHRVTAERTTFRYFLSRCWIEGRGKASLARFVGRSSALAEEWGYVLKVLPRGIGAGLKEAAGGRPAGLARAAAISVGLSVTCVSYVVHRRPSAVSRMVSREGSPPGLVDRRAD
jgi:glycosyltransferase involved in cell wall biosynthesis